MAIVEDELLKWKFRRGNPEALARIYEKYLDSMLTLAMGLLNDRAAAEDVVHDVFVSFARLGPGFRLRGRLSGYLATSVVNRVRDDRRRALRGHRSEGPGRLYRADMGRRPDRLPRPRGDRGC